MCLKNERKLRWRDCIKRWGYIIVYKVVYARFDSFQSDIKLHPFKPGLNTANYGFHSFQTLKGAKNWAANLDTIIKCKIKRCWIKTIGTQRGHVAYRTSKIIIPSVNDKKAIVG